MQTSPLELSGNFFTFKNSKCNCLIDTIHDDKGEKRYTLKIRAILNEYYLYAYAPVEGLVRINPQNGSIIKDTRVIEDLLSLNYDDIESLKYFIEKYGFLLPVSIDNYMSFSVYDLKFIILRFKILVELIAHMESKNYDYNLFFKYVLILVFQKPISIEGTSSLTKIHTCIHPFTKLWFQESIDETNKLLSPVPRYSDFKYFIIKDTFTDKEEELNEMDYASYIDIFGDIEEKYELKDKLWMHLTQLYVHTPFAKNSAKYIIDFLFNMHKDIAPIVSLSLNSNILKGNPDLNLIDTFDEHYKEFLIFIVKQTIKEEFDSALYSIHPVYDIKNMGPDWEIPTFFTAIYFSLFYMRSGYEIFRQCANPNCNCFFRVRTTNSKKIYHDTACQNAAAQMRHRKKKINK